jgi:sec-independent protein translocase protein TatB
MNFGFSEMLFLFFLAMLLFGPKKLPKIAREVGKTVSQFKNAAASVEAQIKAELQQAELAERQTRFGSLQQFTEETPAVTAPAPALTASGAASEVSHG